MNILIKSSLVVALSAIALLSCHGTKKSSTTQASEAAQAPAPVVAPSATVAALPVRNGIIPGDMELQAIQAKYPGTTAQNLANGHELYIGTCTDCHRKKNIFAYSESRWKDIITDMAARSKLNAQQTDDLYKYVLSMKATQNAYAR